MNITRHVGVVRSTGSRVFVAFRSLPNDPNHCLVIYQDSIPEIYAHKVVSFVLNEGQRSTDLYEVMDKMGTLEGKPMLTVLHTLGYLRKQNTKDIDMHVGNGGKIALDLLNASIEETAKLSDGKVKDFNPFDTSYNEEVYPEQTGIVSDLLEKAAMYKKLSEEHFERAYSLDPALRPSTETSTDEGFIVVKLSTDITQTNAILAVKQALKDHKDGKSNS